MIDKLFRFFFGFPHLLRRMQYPHIEKYVKNVISGKKNCYLLDVGCGNGDLVKLLARNVYSVGIEPNILPILIPGKCCFVKASGITMPFTNEMFDVAIMSSVLQMVKQDEKLLHEIYRVLKKRGLLILTVPTEYIFIPHLFTKDGVSRLLRKVFRLPENYQYFRQLLNAKHLACGKGFYQQVEIESLLKNSGFKIVSQEYTPRIIGTFLYEISLIFRYALRINISVQSVVNMLLFSIGWFDRFLPAKSAGCEILLATEKVTS